MVSLSRMRNRKCQGSPNRRPPFRPALEALDGRWLPSTLAVLTVTNTSDSGPGSLRGEVALASDKKYAKDAVTIVFAKGLAGQTITLTTGELELTRSLTIQGPGAGQLTVSGGGVYAYFNSRVFEVVSGASVALSGLTISNGTGYSGSTLLRGGEGGGILNEGTLTLTACNLSNNHANTAGGAIFNLGTLTVSGCTISGNSAYSENGVVAGGNGGGIWNGGTLKVSNTTLSDNTAVYGGGIPTGGYGGGISNAGTLTVSGCTLSGNSADDGGGIYNTSNGAASVGASTLSGNYAQSGGGISNDGTLTVSTSEFTNNSPDDIHGLYTDAGDNTFG